METMIRGANSSDLGFILSTMPRSVRYNSKFWEATDNGRFHKNVFQMVKDIVLNPSISLRILCERSEPSVIYAYAILSLNEANRTLIYAYTKPAFRRQGYIKQLVADAGLNQTAYTLPKLEKARLRNKLELNPWVAIDLLKGERNVSND